MMELSLYGVYLFLAVFNAGNMTTLQIQHYGIYPLVGAEKFKAYIQANNKAAVVPSILPAMLLLLVNMVMLFVRPAFMSGTVAVLSLALSLVSFVSTFVWQRKLQGEMAVTGYDEEKIKTLLATNWIRVAAFVSQGILAVSVIINAISKT
jgi:hypothetical protein